MRQPGGFSLEQFLTRLDRRIVYLGLFVVTLAPLVGRWNQELYPGEPAKRLAAAIDALPQDKVVMLASNWDAGTQAESRPQMVAITRHLISRNLKFAIFAISAPTAPQLAQIAVEDAIRLEGAESRYIEGQQWCNLGYSVADEPWLRSLAASISRSLKSDRQGTPLAEIPMMAGVDRFGPDGQVSMLIDVTGSNTIEKWYQYLTPTRVSIGLGCTGVMGPEQFPYLDSGQLSGLLVGMKGGAEYEKIVNKPGFGMPAMAGQSFAHLYLVLLIILGNVGYALGRARRTGGAGR